MEFASGIFSDTKPGVILQLRCSEPDLALLSCLYPHIENSRLIFFSPRLPNPTVRAFQSWRILAVELNADLLCNP